MMWLMETMGRMRMRMRMMGFFVLKNGKMEQFGGLLSGMVDLFLVKQETWGFDQQE